MRKYKIENKDKGFDFYDWETITANFDQELCNKVHNENAPCEEGFFLEKYLMQHKEKFKEAFTIN